MRAKPKNTVPGRNQRISSKKQRKQQHLLDVKVRARTANRQRNRHALAVLSALFLILAGIGGAAYGGRYALRRFFWQNPNYNLVAVDIHTDGSLTREQILASTGIVEGKNIFTVNLGAARKNVLTLPQVDHAEIDRILPNRISIDISERKPVAWVTGKDDENPSADPGAFLIDHDGNLMRVKNQVPAYYHLPVICGLDVENYEEGNTVDLPEVHAALDLIKLTGENPSRYQVRSIDVSKGYCLVVNDERHATNTFPLEDLPTQIDRLATIYAKADADGREIQTVNLLVQRNVPVTFADQPDPDSDLNANAPAGVAASSSPAANGTSAKKPVSTTAAKPDATLGKPDPNTAKSEFLAVKKPSLHKPHSTPKPTPYVYHEPAAHHPELQPFNSP